MPDFYPAEHASAITRLSRTELAASLTAQTVPGLDGTFYLVADVEALRPRPAKPTVKPKRKQTKKTKTPTSDQPMVKTETPEQPTVRAKVRTTVEPPPVDPETEIEELAQRGKRELQRIARELGLDYAATLYRRRPIAEAIVTERNRQWYARQRTAPDAVDGAQLAQDVGWQETSTVKASSGRKGRKSGVAGNVTHIQFSDGESSDAI